MTNRPIYGKGKLYFGPFISRHTVEDSVTALKDVYQIHCSNPANKHKACLNYSLGLCIGTCLGEPAAIHAHNQIISHIIALLNGTDTSIIEELQEKMIAAGEAYDFKKAAKIRDLVSSITYLLKKEDIIHFTEENHHIVVVERLIETVSKLFLIKRNKILYREKLPTNRFPEHLSEIILKVFNQTADLTVNKVTKEEMDEAQIIYSYLQNSRYAIIPAEILENNDLVELENIVRPLLMPLKNTTSPIV